MNLILDIDGTLINDDASDEKSIVLRPYLEYFLVRAFAIFHDIGIYSAASSSWVNHAVSLFRPLLPHGAEFTFIWNGNRCTRKRERVGCYDFDLEVIKIKRLSKVWRKFQGWTRSNTIIIDNTASCFRENYGNGILIPTFLSTQITSDDYLIRILMYIEAQLLYAVNVHRLEKRRWIKWSIDHEQENIVKFSKQSDVDIGE